MHVRITGDFATDSGLGRFVDEWSGPVRKHFQSRDYGNGLAGLVLVLMCQDSNLQLRRRRRFDGKERKLYLDVMLSLDEMKSASEVAKRKLVVDKIMQEVTDALLEGKKVASFDATGFLSELIGFLETAAA